MKYKFANKTTYKDDRSTIEDVIITQHGISDIAVNLGNAKVEYAANVTTQLLTTEDLDGLPENNKELSKLLERSAWYDIYPNVEYTLAKKGLAALYLIELLDDSYICLGTPYNIVKIGNKIMSVDIVTNTPVDGMIGANVAMSFKYETDPKTNKTTAVMYKIAFYPSSKKFSRDNAEYVKLPEKYNNTIPVEIFKNDHLGLPDANPAIYGIIQQLNYHSNASNEEWQLTKTLLNEMTINGNADSQATLNEIIGGGRLLRNGQVVNRGIPNTELVLSPGTALTMNMALMEMYEDKLAKYLFTFRDSTSSATNKHNTEVATFNQMASEHARFKIRRYRARQYTNFFKNIVGLIIPGLVDIDVTPVISELEDNKVKAMDPTTIIDAQTEGAIKLSKQQHKNQKEITKLNAANGNNNTQAEKNTKD